MATMPRAHRWLFTLLSGALFVLLSAKLLFPIFVKAQAGPSTGGTTGAAAAGGTCDPRIGPELAFFDEGGQTKVFNNVVKKNGFTGPVQVINLITEKRAYNPAPGNPVILRIAGVSSTLTDADIIAYANALKANKDKFPKGTVVFFGNEVSNLEVEWKNTSVSLPAAAQAYARMFNLFGRTLGHDYFRVAPSPPDLYNGVWNPVTWVTAFARAVDCGQIDVLTANVYNVTPAVPGVTNLTTYQYWERSLCGGSKKVVHFSGWGENPNQGAGIQAQIDFFAKNPLPQGVESAATLIVDTCNGFDSNVAKQGWLYYVCVGGQGKVYTASGKRVKNDCSSDVNTYYEYTLNRPEASNILNNFYDEYSVSCLPRNEYTLAIRNRDKCEKYGLCDNWNSTGTLSISANGKLLGLYRDEASANQRLSFREPMEERKESLETFFAAKKSMSLEDLAASEQSAVDSANDFGTSSGVSYKLTDVISQCEFAKEKMKAVEFLCRPENRVKVSDADMSDDPDIQAQCAIDEDIAHSSYTHISLLAAIGNRDCKDLMTPTDDVPTKQLQQAVLEVRQTMEGAYRPAFIVIATTPKDEGKNTELGHEYPDPKSTNGWTVVDFMEIKVPAFATDFINPEQLQPASPTNTAERYYKDAMRLAADAITDITFQQKFAAQDTRERRAVRNSNADISGRNIGDYGTVKCRAEDGKGVGLVDCNTIPLAKALTTFINAYPAAVAEKTAANADVPLTDQEKQEIRATTAQRCEVNAADFFPGGDTEKYETSAEIGSQLEAKDAYYIGSGDNEVKVDRKKEAKVDLSVSSKSIANGEDMSINDTTRVFFVSPYGANLRYARLAFQSMIDDGKTNEEALKSGNFNSLLLTDLSRQLNSAEAKREFEEVQQGPVTQPTDPDEPPVDSTVRRIRDYIGYQLKIAAKSDDQLGKQPLLWQVAGNVANYPTRLFALIGTSYDSVANKFTRSCDGKYATEDWFKETCDVSKLKNPINSPSPAGACSDKYGKTQVPIPTGANATERLGHVAEKVLAAAKSHGLSTEETYLMWGLIEIEGSPYLRAVRAGGKTSITCQELINSCGAVGPYQIVDGICTQSSCPAADSMSRLVKSQTAEQLCNIEGAADFVATKLAGDRNYVDSVLTRRGFSVAEQHKFFLAARYAGLNLSVLGGQCTASPCPDGTSCQGGLPVQGCGTDNYCQCANSDSFAARFRTNLRSVGVTPP